MDNTHFSKRVQILSALWFFYAKDDAQPQSWRDFFDWADVGLPLSYAVSNDYATLTDEGMEIIVETWEQLCKMLAIDPYPTEMYDSLDQMMKLMPDED